MVPYLNMLLLYHNMSPAAGVRANTIYLRKKMDSPAIVYRKQSVIPSASEAKEGSHDVVASLCKTTPLTSPDNSDVANNK